MKIMARFQFAQCMSAFLVFYCVFSSIIAEPSNEEITEGDQIKCDQLLMGQYPFV